jgi:YVTN family beta-propeller protein
MALIIQDLKKTYVGPDGSAVPVIDVATLRVVGTVAVGEGPNGITFRGAVQ